jgi:hypothetical protein
VWLSKLGMDSHAPPPCVITGSEYDFDIKAFEDILSTLAHIAGYLLLNKWTLSFSY